MGEQLRRKGERKERTGSVEVRRLQVPRDSRSETGLVRSLGLGDDIVETARVLVAFETGFGLLIDFVLRENSTGLRRRRYDRKRQLLCNVLKVSLGNSGSPKA